MLSTLISMNVLIGGGGGGGGSSDDRVDMGMSLPVIELISFLCALITFSINIIIPPLVKSMTFQVF